jgi:hypothetical protein
MEDKTENKKERNAIRKKIAITERGPELASFNVWKTLLTWKQNHCIWDLEVFMATDV